MIAALRFVRLLSIAWSLSSDLNASVDVARDAVAATDDDFEGRWLVVWGWHESRWKTDAVDPMGATFGCMQIDASTWGRTPPDRVGQFTHGLHVLTVLRNAYGTKRRALNAYATGSPSRNTHLVEARCRALGCE
jgi:hypothetical protein